MISLKTITGICLGVTFCTAQTINISGVVKDSANIGISGATVKLEKAGISTTTGTGGSFTLSSSSAKIQPDFRNSAVEASPMQIQNGKLVLTLSENTPVDISVHDVSGRQVYMIKKTYCSGIHAIGTHQKSVGILLYKVKIGNKSYSFKSSPLGTLSTGHNAKASNSSTLAKQAEAEVVVADVISVVKNGKLNYRDSIKTSDTTGIVIKMIPNAGDVKDADGNVYQSVRIGKQVWTVENLKTTKYNDGTDIPNVTGNTQWQNLTTGAYCYYDNNTGYKDKYGALYNWYAVNTNKLAPKGWRVPTDDDWSTLLNYLKANGYNYYGVWDNMTAKSMAAKTDWAISPRIEDSEHIGHNLSINNASGFSALPGGERSGYAGSVFRELGTYSYFWSTSVHVLDTSEPCFWYLHYNYSMMSTSSTMKSTGYSVRLLND